MGWELHYAVVFLGGALSVVSAAAALGWCVEEGGVSGGQEAKGTLDTRPVKECLFFYPQLS